MPIGLPLSQKPVLVEWYLFIHSVEGTHYLTGPYGCPVYAVVPVSVFEAVLEPHSRRAAAGGTCSCHWAGSVCVPLQASGRSAGCPPLVPQDRAAPAVVKRAESQGLSGA